MNQALLMIEDDVRLARMVVEYLGQSGYAVTHAPDATQGLAALRRAGEQSVSGSPAQPMPALVILDLMLPDMDGLEVCRRIRALPGALGRVPLLMLTAKGDPMDRIIGLEMGADDYLPKPFEPRELLARIRAVLRRHGEPVVLTAGELELLRVLTEHADRVLDRDCLLDLLKGYERSPFDRSIDVQIARLRAKIEPDTKHPRYIRTVWGKGYLFTPDGAP